MTNKRLFDAKTIYYFRAGIGLFCSGLIFISLSAYYIRTIGMNPLQLVLVGTTLEFTGFLFEIPTGIVADQYSRRLSMIVGGILVGICYVLTGLFPLFIFIILAEVIRGLGGTFISGAESAWITDEVGAAQVRNVFLRRAQIGQVTNLLGIWCSVLLASLFGYQVPIFLGGLGLIILNLVLVFIMPESNFVPLPTENRATYSQMVYILKQGVTIVQSNMILMLLIGVEFIVGAASEGFDRLVEAHYLQNLHMPLLVFPGIGQLDPIAWFAIWNVFSVVIGITLLEFMRRRIKTDHPVRAAKTLMTIEAISIVSTIAFGLTLSFPVAFLSELIRATCRQLSNPIRDTWLNQNIPSHVRATVLSLHNQSNAFGQMIGGPGVGWVGNRFGIQAALVLAGILLMPVLTLYQRTMTPKTRILSS